MLDALPAELLVRAHKLDSVAQISAHAPSGDRRCKTRHLVAVHTNLAAERKSPGGRRFLHGSLQGQLCRLLKQERGPPHEPKQDKIEELCTRIQTSYIQLYIFKLDAGDESRERGKHRRQARTQASDEKPRDREKG